MDRQYGQFMYLIEKRRLKHYILILFIYYHCANNYENSVLVVAQNLFL